MSLSFFLLFLSLSFVVAELVFSLFVSVLIRFVLSPVLTFTGRSSRGSRRRGPHYDLQRIVVSLSVQLFGGYENICYLVRRPKPELQSSPTMSPTRKRKEPLNILDWSSDTVNIGRRSTPNNGSCETIIPQRPLSDMT